MKIKNKQHKVRTEEKRPWLVHAVAYCQECDWKCEDYHIAVRAARDHARQTGHKIVVETGYAQTYNPAHKDVREWVVT